MGILADSVLQKLSDIIAGEGMTPWMYLDNKGLLTVGRGNLIDTSVSGATDPVTLNWIHASTGAPVSPSELAAAIAAVRARTDLIPYGGAGTSPSGEGFRTLSDVQLTQASVNQLVQQAGAQLASSLAIYLPSFPQFPADAQAAILRFAWARGPNLKVKAPKMYAYLAGTTTGGIPDFRAAAQEAHWLGENPDVATLIPQLFHNAADVVDHGLDVSQLVWPNSVVVGPDGVASSTDPQTFSGDPIDWSGFSNVHSEFGLEILTNARTFADVNALKVNYDKWIPQLRERFDQIKAAWSAQSEGLSFDRSQTFEKDLQGLESRWAMAHALEENNAGVQKAIELTLGSLPFGIEYLYNRMKGDKAPLDETLPAQMFYDAYLGAINQNSHDGLEAPPIAGDFENLRQRLFREETILGVDPILHEGGIGTALVPGVFSPPIQPTDKDAGSHLGKDLDKSNELLNWLKVIGAGVTVGLLLQAFSNYTAMQRAQK